jgi:hypothetical protein
MKGKLLIALAMILQAPAAFADQIVSAKWLPESSEIELTVRHGGGCKSHQWGLTWNGGCAETFPAQCSANLVHLRGADDFCEALVSTTSRVKWTAHPYDQYILAIKGGTNTKTLAIVAKRSAGGAKSCTMVDARGKTVRMKPGDSRPDRDGCNTCTCQESGHIACTELACAPTRGCTFAGKKYSFGQRFPDVDGCNTCTCRDDGSVACTEIACVR